MIQELFDVLLPFACFAFCLVSNQITNTHRDTILHETRQLLLPSLLHSDDWQELNASDVASNTIANTEKVLL
jgi:hypothetical protein